MKKRISSKSKNSKAAKPKSSPASMAVERDIEVLLTTLVSKLTSFETKIDAVLNRIMSQPFEGARKQQDAASFAGRHRESMRLHKVICADCSRSCEVPFKPSGNRPVYCRECFAKRKNKGTFKPREERKPNEVTRPSVRLPEKPKMSKPINPPKKKKPTVKKKTAVKKKKKSSRKRNK